MPILINFKNKLVSIYRSKIREQAISRAKKRLATAGKSVNSFSADELEIIVREEEEALITDIKTGSLFAALLILGVN